MMVTSTRRTDVNSPPSGSPGTSHRGGVPPFADPLDQAVGEAARWTEPAVLGKSQGRPLARVGTLSRDQLLFAIGLLGLFVTWVTIWAALAVTVSALLPGWTSVVITSNSMAPRIQTGDIVIASSHGEGPIVPGTVIVFEDGSESELTAHRVVAVNDDGTLLTRGDANALVDSTPVDERSVVGEGRLLFPYIGRPLVWFQTGEWLFLFASALALMSALQGSSYAFPDRGDLRMSGG